MRLLNRAKGQSNGISPRFCHKENGSGLETPVLSSGESTILPLDEGACVNDRETSRVMVVVVKIPAETS